MNALDFHRSLPGYRPTPVHVLRSLAEELEVASVLVKDESDRFGLPAFKILGASWAVQRALEEREGVRTLVAASAGNHGRAVARAAAMRGLACRIVLPERSRAARRAAIAAEGAEVIVAEGGYEGALARAAEEAARPGALEIADFGSDGCAKWVIEGYETLFEEAAAQAELDLLIVPVGAGSLAAAAVRFAKPRGIAVVGVEPETAACLATSLEAGEATPVETPGTTMAGLDCGELSPAAWPILRDGIRASVTVDDGRTHAAMRELASAGLAIGDCGAAPLAALRRMATESRLRETVGLSRAARVMLVASEGVTDPDGYSEVVGRARA